MLFVGIADYVTKERVAIREVEGKESALRTVASLLANGIERTADEVYRVLVERERLATTGVGSGVAVPHGRLKLEQTRAAFLMIPGGVDFESIDGTPVNFVLGVLAPEDQPTRLLRLLAEASRVLRDDERRERLMVCSNSDCLLVELSD